MKIRILFALFISVVTLNAQSLKGELTLNGKSETEIKLETNSAVQLFKLYKMGKYQLKFNFDAQDIPENVYGETIILFQFRTEIYRNGKLVKNLARKQPIPYFPGDIMLPAEAFDFPGLFIVTTWDDMEEKPESFGVLPEGKYKVKLYAKPVNVKGAVEPVEFQFVLRKRPGRAKCS